MKKRLLAALLSSVMVFTMSGTYMTRPVALAAKQNTKNEQRSTIGMYGNTDGFLLSDGTKTAKVYVDKAHEEISEGEGKQYCGMEIIANTFADDVEKVTGKKAEVIYETKDISDNVIIAGTVENNEVIKKLVSQNVMDVSGLYKDDKLKWDCYQMQFISGTDLEKCGYTGVKQALVIAGSNKRGAMYGLFHISERIGVSAWVYMADAVPVQYSAVYLDRNSLEFNSENMFLSKEPSVKYRGFFINDESPSFTGWANKKFRGLNEKCYENIFELLIRMKANYMWPAMWGNSFSDEGSEFKLANVVMADAYGVCMGTSHHEACCRAGIEWGKIYKNYGTDRAWDYENNGEAIYKFWEDGIKRNGNYENTITLGMRGEGDSALKGGVEYNINLLKKIFTDQFKILDGYQKANPNSKVKDAPKIYIPYSENEEYFYGPDDGSIKGLNTWEGMDDVTIMLTDDNYGNIRSLPEESVRDRKAGWGLYYHLDGHVGSGAYEWVSSTQLEHIWDQLTMAHEYNVRDIWVVNVGDIKPLEMELNYCMDLAYDMDKWGQENTAEKYRQEWIQKQLGGKANCPDDVAKGVADCVADFLKISTYRKPEYVSSKLYSTTNYNEAQEVLDLCLKTIEESNYYYNTYFKGTKWDDAFYQLVYYQAVGTANVTQMQIFKSLSDFYASQKSSLANTYYDLVQKCVAYDKELTSYYNNTMSNKKWNKMMSSPHVGFVTWNSTGWKYPTGTQVTLEENAKMIVSVDGDSKGYQTGKATLPTFTNTQKQRYCVTMSNAGQKEYDFTVEAKEDWIQITDKRGKKAISGGTVADAEYFYVAIDWSKVTADASGTILVKGTNATVEITIKADYTKYKDKGVNTHIESNDVVTIDAAEYSKKVDSANGVSWGCINGYGRYQSAMKMFPTTVSFTEKTGNTYKVTSGNTTRTVTEYKEPKDAPYLEYQIYVDEDGEYTFTAYTTTTNNIFKPSGWGYVPVELFYGIQVDDGTIQTINSLPDGKYISYAADGDNHWIKGIKDNIHVSSSQEKLTEGVHKVRIYGMHAGLGLERLVVSNKKLASSYLGPQKTFQLTSEDSEPAQQQGVHYEARAEKEEPVVPTPTPTITPDTGNSTSTQPSPTPANPSGVSDTTKKTDTTVTLSKTKPYTVKKLKYKITKLGKNKEVSLVAPTSKKAQKAVIPAQVSIKGMKFKVTSIAKKAFLNNKKLSSVTIGSQISKIGAQAFQGCKKLKKIVIQSPKMSVVGKKAFQGVPKKATVKVPKKSLKNYKKLLRVQQKYKFAIHQI